MIARSIDLEEEWDNYIKSDKAPDNFRDVFYQGAFCVYKMIISAEDDVNKLRHVMYSLGEQFRKEWSKQE